MVSLLLADLAAISLRKSYGNSVLFIKAHIQTYTRACECIHVYVLELVCICASVKVFDYDALVDRLVIWSVRAAHQNYPNGLLDDDFG